MIKMVALDMDGTLLNPDKRISEAALVQLARLFDEGRYITIATGRPLGATLNFLEESGINPDMCYPHCIVSNERDYYILQDGEYTGVSDWNKLAYQREIELLPQALQSVDSLQDQHKLWFFTNNRVMQTERGFVELEFHALADAYQGVEFFENSLANSELHPVRNGFGVSLRCRDYGKGAILHKVAAHFALTPGEILVMGDSQNDRSMLVSDFVPATNANADQDIKALVIKRGGKISKLAFSEGVADILSSL